jgi:ABC-type polysaccharide/polyol phosphate export permease
MRRVATIIAGAIVGAFAGLFATWGFFTWYDPYPRVATQDGMGYGLLVIFVIMPACCIGLALLIAQLTRPK